MSHAKLTTALPLVLCSALCLSACDKPAPVAPPAPVAVPGPAGPPGEPGKTGDSTTVIVVPPAEPAK